MPTKETLAQEADAMKRYAITLTRDMHTADDLVQDCMERAMRKWTLRREGVPLRAWLFTMMRNLHVDGWRRAKRRQYPLALLMVDIDFFKAYNDKLGHVKGDHCLRDVAQSLSTHARRPGDLVARYGGEEFSVILPALDIGEAFKVAEFLCQKIRELNVPHPGSDIAPCVTVSIGVAAQVPNEHNERSDLIKQADDALYLAKKRGRNRVEIMDSTDIKP